MPGIKKVGHVVLGVRDVERSIKFYTEVVGMEYVNHLTDDHMPVDMAFFSFGERDHDIAVVKVPDEQPVGSPGLSHTALEIDGGEADLLVLYQRLQQHGTSAEFAADHTITKSIYFLDPDGNRLEIFSQEIPVGKAKETMHGFTTMAQAFTPWQPEPAKS